MVILSAEEQKFHDDFWVLKQKSGSHSPSIISVLDMIGKKNFVDACFLSNPYATSLFLEYFNKEIIDAGKLREYIEAYPPQNREIAEYLTKVIDVPAKNIFVGNGAIEIIQGVIHNFIKGKIIINIPTFSSYYEYVKNKEDVIYYQLPKERNYSLNIEKYIEYVKEVRPDSIVIINPNNPNGDYISLEDIELLLKELSFLTNIIIDESFIHFAYEDADFSMINAYNLLTQYPNLILIKSLAKDFGIAGLRAGYAIMSEDKVTSLLETGYQWNIGCFASYFYRLYSRPDFMHTYDIVRKKYIMNTLMFISELSRIPEIKVYPSKANFALIELLDGTTSKVLMAKLLHSYGVYARDCSDKVGLNGQFLRIASRTFEENMVILNALKDIFKNG
jgi:histidinol-phosphate/aromatic aminotransferase/cobyric acid decarboxylase-like protein